MTEESGGRINRASRMLFRIGLLAAVSPFVVIHLLLEPRKTGEEVYYIATGQWERITFGEEVEYEHDHIDEMWMRNRGEDRE